MTSNSPSGNSHPAPHARRVGLHESFFGLFGGPIAWFLQLCAGFALATQPCFVDGERLGSPSSGGQWTGTAMVVLMVAGVLIALIACAVSWKAYRRTQDESPGGGKHLLETGAGRTRFLSLWGVLLGAGFALATTFTAVGFLTLPRCGG